MQSPITLPIANMNCGGCAARVGDILKKVEGVRDVAVNLAGENAQLTLSDAPQMRQVLKALADGGYPARDAEATLKISGMSCASCAARLNRALESEPGVIRAHVNFANETTQITYVPGLVTMRDLIAVTQAAGYPGEPLEKDAALVQDTSRTEEAETHKRAMLISALLTLPVFVLEMGGHLVTAVHHLIAKTIGMETSWTIQFLLTTLVLTWPGRGFFTAGVPALWRRAPDMNSLVALGAGAAWLFSTVALFAPEVLPQGTRAVYFEAAAVIVTLILLGRWFEARAKGQTGAAIRKLVGLQPRVALVSRDDAWVETSVEALKVGDTILLQPGARVPTDAEVIGGTSRVDESMITGEPMQVAKRAGDALTGGSVNGQGSLTCRVTRVGADTTLAHIIRMVQQAQGARLPIQALVDRVTLWFVPAVIAVAMLTILVWLLVGPEPVLSHALVVGVSVLIIACPCAMGLATPTSIMVGTGRAAELGVLFRQGDALQSLSDVEVVAMDKTGTITEGRPALTTFSVSDGLDKDILLARLAAVEQHSEHPLAQAVIAAAEGSVARTGTVTDVEIVAGKGIKATVDGAELAIGNRSLMQDVGACTNTVEAEADRLAGTGQGVFFAAQNGKLAALLAVSDPVRESTITAIKHLQAQGKTLAMITGDTQQTAQAVADQIGIKTVFANVLPSEKVDALRDLRTRYGKVAFVGDGINDAPVLAEADVGIAIGTGTDVAIETADVVLMSSDLRGVGRAFDLSRQTLRNIKQNLVWAFGYNTLLIPVAAGVFYPAFGWLLSPALAAGAMAFSSVFVVGNALRLRGSGGVR